LGAAAQIDALHGAGFSVEAETLVGIQLAIAGNADEALAKSELALQAVGDVDSTTRVTAAVLRTAALLMRDDRPRARLAILDALSRAAPQELLYLLSVGLTAGPGFLDLLSEESERVGAHPYATTALSALEQYLAHRVVPLGRFDPSRDEETVPAPAEVPSRITPARQTARIVVNGAQVTLTERELDVLEQLALGSSYHEIGLALYITDNTVKTHLASLYRKLGVERKSAALRTARDLGLL
jgi:ATP/maltotriose-dependent transcriptional regulator MalT